jgi:hypothetical protein
LVIIDSISEVDTLNTKGGEKKKQSVSIKDESGLVIVTFWGEEIAKVNFN